MVIYKVCLMVCTYCKYIGAVSMYQRRLRWRTRKRKIEHSIYEKNTRTLDTALTYFYNEAVAHIHCILMNQCSGTWYVQNPFLWWSRSRWRITVRRFVTLRFGVQDWLLNLKCYDNVTGIRIDVVHNDESKEEQCYELYSEIQEENHIATFSN